MQTQNFFISLQHTEYISTQNLAENTKMSNADIILADFLQSTPSQICHYKVTYQRQKK